MSEYQKSIKRTSNILKICLLFLSIIIFIYITLSYTPVKIIHIDALHFMSIFQEEYETAKSFTEIPATFLRGIEKSNDYDWGRGRITNYIAFGIEALSRNILPFPFISWLTMAIVLLNTSLLAYLVTKSVEDLSKRVSLFSLTMLLIVINPLVQYSYQLQFIYPKYLCITFLLLFFISKKMPFRLLFLMCAILSDEIGLIAAMLIIFITSVAYCMEYRGIKKTGQSIVISGNTAKLFKSFLYGLIASFMVLLLYYLTIIAIFGTYGILSKAEHSIISLTNMSVIYASAKYIFKTANTILGGNFIVTILILFLCGYLLLKNIHKIMQAFSFREARSWNPVISQLFSTHLIHYFATAFLLLFIVFVMYNGAPNGLPLFAYYAYPVAMLLTFLLISLLVRNLSYKHAVALIILLAFLAITKVPNTINSMENLPDLTLGFRSTSISQQDFNKLETAINELKQQNRSPVFEEINNHQELNFSGGYLYTKNYFPVSGMVRVLIWPKKIPGERTNYKQMNPNKIKHWDQLQERVTKKIRKIFQ